MKVKKIWWKEVTGYQIYPRSFMDSNGDGIGDINGIISKLDYLKELGIDLIWVSPMYESPNDDNGYDISDYQNILKEFGTMEEFNLLLSEVHKRGMKLILDLVINHTSDEHPWFIESKSSRDNPKRDWYIWKDPRYDKNGKRTEPNNWESIFKGSAWEYSEETGQYYLHLFSKKQPDLNWENKEVRQEIYKMINWWLDKGIDGFRVDAISHIKKEDGLEDMPNPKKLKYVESFDKHMNVQGIHKYLEELKENTFSKYDIMTVGEANGVTTDDAHLWVGDEEGKFNMVFQFEHLDLWGDEEKKSKFNVKKYKKILSKWQDALNSKGWNALFVENHDIPRVTSTWGCDNQHWKESATAFAATYFFQKGTPFIYQGQEIGMTNVEFPSIIHYQDIASINTYNEKKESGIPEEEILKEIRSTSRDNARTPMQWDSSKNAGFTTGIPWLGMNNNYYRVNVEAQRNDEKSIFNFYKKMITLRKSSDALIYGDYKLILKNNEKIYAYTRSLEDEIYLIISNLTNDRALYKFKSYSLEHGNLVLNNYPVEKHGKISDFTLEPYETRVYKVNK